MPKAQEAEDLRCVCCGLVIHPGSKSKKYCSPACAEKYREMTIPQSAAPTAPFTQGSLCAEDERPKCLECGKPIPLGSRKRKYCCAECADKAMVRMKEAYKKKRKTHGGVR